MKGKGLSAEIIVSAATELTVKEGFRGFSIRDLARELGCKAASLYKYFASMDDIRFEIGRNASLSLNRTLEEAAQGKVRDDALGAVAYAYHDYILHNYDLYLSIMAMPSLSHSDSVAAGRLSMQIFRHIMNQYEIPPEKRVHFSRMLRGELHGFTLFETSGYYSAKRAECQESFRFIIERIIDAIHAAEKTQVS